MATFADRSLPTIVLSNERSSTLAALTSVLVIAACSADGVTTPPGGEAGLSVRADVSATSAATVVVEVTGSGITPPLVFNLAVANGVASGTITIPAGSGRTITMRAYDAGGVQTHGGSVTVNIQPGTTTPITLVLAGLTGEVPITATLGSIRLTVMPSPATVGVGLTVTLVATLADTNGSPMSGTVNWATSNPGVATVTSAGVVTGMHAGQTNITGTFQGAAGSSTVTVAAWPNDPGLPLVTDNPWNSLTSPGWQWMRIFANEDPDIVVDATAPFSPPSTVRHIFTAAMQNGEAPQMFWYPTYGLGYREVYFAWWFKYSANFAPSAQGLTKLTYVLLNGPEGIQGSAWTAVVGSGPIELDGGPPYFLGYHIQWPPYGTEQTVLPNVTATPINVNEWHLVEWYIKFPTVPGAASDGVLRIWVDGVKNHEYTNIGMPAGATEFGEFQHTPISEVVMPFECYIYLDHTHLSAR